MSYPQLLAASDDGRWQIGIGDPSVYGWVTVAAYLFAAVLCVLAWHRSRGLDIPRGQWRLRLFWLGLAGAMLVLGINKQLDLQSLVTQVGKDLAKEQGWYQDRRAVQKQFVYGVAAAGGVCVLFAGLLLWGHLRRTWLALLGIVLTVSFVVIRAASFHHFDQLIGKEIAGVRLNVLFELGGITLVALGAWMNRCPPRQERT